MQTLIDSSLPTDAVRTESACFAIIWVQGVESENQADQILRDIDNHHGVRTARFSRRHPYILVVDYDPDRIRTTRLLEAINGPGMRARVVGC